MAGLWQRTGNATVTNGSRTVTGFGTKWKTGTLPIQKGHAFYGPDGVANEVDTVVSDTEILLVEAYRGGTMANQSYKIDITRTSTISQFSAELSALVGKYRTWFDSMMTWLTGSGDVGILNPDTGATVTIPSWKKVASEGEGQAARAKAEADKALAAADLAVNVVRDSAMPLPDVWMPLNDDLRMITGFGGDVKVGELTVAKRANFERITGATYVDKSTGLRLDAAINVPRFEAPGLLIEKPSTNLFTESGFTGSNWTIGGSGVSLEKLTAPEMGGDFARLKATTADAVGRSVRLKPLALSLGTVYTITVTVRRPVGSPFDGVRLGVTPGFTPNDSVIINGLVEGAAVDVVLTGTASDASSPATVFVWPRVAGAASPSVPVGTEMIDVGDIQIEVGSISTSRIRSKGSQASRAQDKVWLQELGNMLPLNRDFTLSFTAVLQYDTAEYGCIYASGVFPVITRFIVWPSTSSLLRFYIGNASFAGLTTAQTSTILPSGVPRRVTLIRRGSVSEMWIAGVKVATSGSTNEAGFTNGQIVIGADDKFVRPIPRMHIRDWRVWHFAASEAQAKSIR